MVIMPLDLTRERLAARLDEKRSNVFIRHFLEMPINAGRRIFVEAVRKFPRLPELILRCFGCLFFHHLLSAIGNRFARLHFVKRDF